MTIIPIYRPYVFLRCKKCGRKTGHVLINAVTTGKDGIEETFECQECGETKKIYELASMVGRENLSVQELKEKVKAKREVVEHLESKKKDLEKRLKESQKKEPMEVKIKEAPTSQQPKQTEEQPKAIKIKKKKRRWF